MLLIQDKKQLSCWIHPADALEHMVSVVTWGHCVFRVFPSTCYPLAQAAQLGLIRPKLASQYHWSTDLPSLSKNSWSFVCSFQGTVSSNRPSCLVDFDMMMLSGQSSVEVLRAAYLDLLPVGNQWRWWGDRTQPSVVPEASPWLWKKLVFGLSWPLLVLMAVVLLGQLSSALGHVANIGVCLQGLLGNCWGGVPAIHFQNNAGTSL